jgi:hypothetical protein
MLTNPVNILIAHRRVNVEIGTEAAQFPEKEYIHGSFLAVHARMHFKCMRALTTAPTHRAGHFKKIHYDRMMAAIFVSLTNCTLYRLDKWGGGSMQGR